jgi:hypothetical protein
MVRRVLAVTLALGACSVLTPSLASAAYVTGFRVRDNGAHIKWYVNVCGGGRVKAFSAWLLPENGWPTYRRSWNGGRNPGTGCNRWSMRAEDIWAEGIWTTQLRVIMSNGQILRTPVREIYIS